ncbi:MAG: NAD(P)/FAD-dependent oxidoreductase [Halobacteriaceae archaeon]
MEVAVVGAGAVGATAARDLADAGAAVTVYERDTVGSGATARAAGIVHDAVTVDVDAELHDRALERFRSLSAAGRFRFHHTPYLWFVTDDAGVDALDGGVERMQAAGRAVERLAPTEVRARFPQVRAEDIAAAAVATDAGVADPEAYARLMAHAAQSAGATLREGVPAAVGLDPPRVVADGATRYDAVVVAAGADTGSVLADAGVPVALQPYRVQALLASGPAVPSLYDATAGYYLRPHEQGLLAGDGAGPAGEPWDRSADPAFVERTLDRLDGRLVNLETEVSRSWAGRCTATPDGDPLLGRMAEGLYVAAGWHGSGFMRAPATGEAVAEQVLGGEGVPAFDPGRFDGDEAFDPVPEDAPLE